MFSSMGKDAFRDDADRALAMFPNVGFNKWLRKFRYRDGCFARLISVLLFKIEARLRAGLKTGGASFPTHWLRRWGCCSLMYVVL